ncbi:hypothetical protein [Mycobacterium sp.]|uniref:hypothetical protein n=1 Tax=Mycobacterium sp. TaxID=1785 RepID=UPI003C78AA91
MGCSSAPTRSTRSEKSDKGGVSTIGPVARRGSSEGPPDEFNRLPTQQARSGTGEYPLGPPPQAPQAPQESQEPEAWQDLPTTYVPFQSGDSDDLETEPTPWYRKPVNLIIWAVLVLILIGLIVYGIIELIGGDQGTGNTPSSTTTTTPTTTVPPTTSTSASPPPSTTPSSSTPVEPPPPQPTRQPTHQPTEPPSSTHHHLPPLPSVITIPGGPVVTLPPDLTR